MIFSKKLPTDMLFNCYFSMHEFIFLINLYINIFMRLFDKATEVNLCMYKSSCQHIILHKILKISPIPKRRSFSHYTADARVRSRTNSYTYGISCVQTVCETRSFPYTSYFPSLAFFQNRYSY